MSVPYRSEHDGIFLDTAFSESSNTILQPHLHNAGFNQTNGNHAYSILSDRKHQLAYESMKMMNASSPISPLSPQQSSPCSETCPPSRQTLGSHYDTDKQRWSDNSNQSCSSNCREPYFHGGQSYLNEGLSYQSVQHPFETTSTLESSSSPGSGTSLQSYHSDSYIFSSVKASVAGTTHISVGQKSVKNILQELETVLMGPDDEDTDLVGSVCGGYGLPPDGDWNASVDVLSKSSQHASSSVQKQGQIMSEQYAYAMNQHHIKASAPSLQNLSMSEIHKQVVPEQFCCPSNAPPFQPSLGLQHVKRASEVEQMLVACAAATAENKYDLANVIMERLKELVSIYGDPIQRLAAYMAEGLVARLESSGTGIYRALKCKETPAADVLSAMQKMYEICPYFKFGYMAANGAIAEAFKDEEKVHIFDIQIVHGTQWISLIQALANRPGGPPSLRITGVDDPESQSGPAGGLQFVGQRLGKLAESVGVPFEFYPLPVKMAEVKASMIELRPGEALAVNFALQLHHMPDESVSITNPRDRLLRMVKGMNPKVVTLVEQEANTNTSPFFPRFLETLEYYRAVFDSIDVALPRDSKDRVNVETQCLARDIVNIIACEGSERVERHELLGKWRARMQMAGFRPHPLSSFVNNTINVLLQMYCEHYRLVEESGALFLGWLNRPLIVASAWQ